MGQKHSRIQIRVTEDLKNEAEKILMDQYGVTMSEFLRKQLETLCGKDNHIPVMPITIERNDKNEK